MSTINLGRVQGAGIFYSTASSGTSVAKSTLAPNGIVPLVGDSILFPNGDLRKITAVSGTNVTCGNVETNFKERPSNVLQEAVMVNRQAGVTQGDMANLGYALGLEEGKMYTVKYKFNGVDIVATAKYEAVAEDTIEGATLALCQSISAEGQTMAMSMLLGVQDYNASLEDYQSAALDYGFLYIVDKHQITGDAIYTADENNSSVYVRALQSANAQNAVTVELTSIDPFVENVADKAIADGEGNNIVTTYAKQNGNYSDMSVGNADKLGDKAASEYALMTIKTATEWETDNTILAAGALGYDSTNKITKMGDGSTSWKALPFFTTSDLSFSKASWGQIAALSEGGSASKYFSVGDEKTIELTTGEEITLVILGFNHDDLTSGGKAGITIGMKNLLATTYKMNSSNTHEGGWNNSEMRTSTMATLLSQLPSDLQAVIKSVDKKATSGGGSTTITTSSDKLFLFSEVEIDGTTAAGRADEGKQYEYWKTIKDGTIKADRIKYLSNGGGSAYQWYLRSPYLGSSPYWLYINTDGAIVSSFPSHNYGVSFGFCV